MQTIYVTVKVNTFHGVFKPFAFSRKDLCEQFIAFENANNESPYKDFTEIHEVQVDAEVAGASDLELVRPVLTRAFAGKMLELIASVSSYAESFVIDRTSRDRIVEGLQLLAETIRKPLLGEESEGATDA